MTAAQSAAETNVADRHYSVGSCCLIKESYRRASAGRGRRSSDTTALAHSDGFFGAVSAEFAEQLRYEPGVQAIALLEWLQEHYPGQYPDNLLRTL